MKKGRNDPTAALRDRAQFWVERLHARPKVVRIQAMTRKWGSCSTRRVVTLALDLGREPVSVQDVVIVHELLHLRIRNHGRMFKALMSAHVPHWRQVDRLPPGLAVHAAGPDESARTCEQSPKGRP